MTTGDLCHKVTLNFVVDLFRTYEDTYNTL